MFRNEFKYYKSKRPPPNYTSVIDFQSIHLSEKVVQRQPCVPNDFDIISKYGLIEITCWKVFEFKQQKGLIFIVNPFTNKGQQYWIQRCLQDYTKKPNRLNLDPFDELKPEEDWWDVSLNDITRGEKIKQKLRWATLGYHHNWDTKEYSEAHHSEFPEDLAHLSDLIVQVVGDPACGSYKAEAAIVNFYHLDSTLSGHKDESEPNMKSPLLSISFGQSAVFLVGGENLDDPVTAMFLHSGDIIVMSGESRRYYHGVPRIIPAKNKSWAGDDWEFSEYGKYIDSSRINMNVRQVLLPGQDSLNR